MELVINDRIRNRQIALFNKVRVSLKFDSVASTFAFEYYFNPDNGEHKELSCIGHYHTATLKHNGETLLTGYVLSIAFNGGPVRQMVSLGGYSLPGVLEDCEIPIGLEGMSLENEKMSLKDIAIRYLKPFGLGLIVDESVVLQANNDISEEAPVYTPAQTIPATAPPMPIEEMLQPQFIYPVEQVATIDKWGMKITPWGNDSSSVTDKMDEKILKSTAQVGQNIKSYLAKLASYKNIILSHDEKGNVVFTKAKKQTKPVATYNQGVSATSMSLSFNGQQMHSHISCVQQPDTETASDIGEPSTVANPYVPYVFRPKTIVVSNPPDGVDYTLTSAKNALATELRGLKLIITTDKWTFPNGKIIRPNNIINVQNSEIYLYKNTRWFIEEVELSGDEKQQTAKLICVLPFVYDGTQPQYYFEGINLLHKH